jgi:hypothetical protein
MVSGMRISSPASIVLAFVVPTPIGLVFRNLPGAVRRGSIRWRRWRGRGR